MEHETVRRNMDESKKLLEKNTSSLFKKENVLNYSGLNLAYIGDAVFEILVRTYVMNTYNSTVGKMDKLSRSYVKASSQSLMFHELINICTEKEVDILKRGRNAKSHTSAKNATTNDYRHATGLEALFGYLYLEGEVDRIMELFAVCVKTIEKSGGNNGKNKK